MLHIPGQPSELIDGADAMPGKKAELQPDHTGWRQVHIPYGDGIDVMAGHASIAVPGLLAALELAWKRHGSLPWREIIAPAVELATSGWPAAQASADWLALTAEFIFGHQKHSRESFFQNNTPIRTGDLMRIPGLAQTMELIANQGARAFYQGELAAAFAKEMHENGGHITREDLAAYQPIVRKPLELTSRGFHLALNPLPAVGGAALGSLIGLLEFAQQQTQTPAQRALLHARAQAHVLGLRARDLADPAFNDAAARALLEPETLTRHAHALRSPHTTHLSVTTADGCAVAITMSMGYGAGVTIPGTGIACNNSLGEPELNPAGYFAAPPGTRMISNMAPTVAWNPDGRCIAIGSPGASRITTAIAQTWARYAFEGMSLEQAVVAPRLHLEEWHDGLRVQCEPGIDTSLLHPELTVRQFERAHMFFGGTHLTGIDEDARLHAVADPRRNGVIAIA
jgi:gamma-glutamyltranspeptidase/glutathione hydrolase